MADQLKVCWLRARLLSGSMNPPALVPPPLLQHFLEPLSCARAMRGQQHLEAGTSGFMAGLPSSGPWAPHNLVPEAPQRARHPHCLLP